MNHQYGVLDLLWDIRDARTICVGDALSKSILLALASRCQPGKGFVCYPSVEMVAGDVQASVRIVQERLKMLVSAKLITRQRRFSNSYIYRLSVSTIRAAAAEQRTKWEAEKAQEREREYGSEESRTSAVEAEDAEFSGVVRQVIDYGSALAEEIRGLVALEVSEHDVQTVATAVCSAYPGSAPLLAIALLDDVTLTKIAEARNSAGYLRTVLERKIKELSAAEYVSNAENIQKFVEWEINNVASGGRGFSVQLTRHPRWIDDRIEALARCEDVTFATPYIAEDEDGEVVLVFKYAESEIADED